jgi:8-oxo-dGTP diphosphatase
MARKAIQAAGGIVVRGGARVLVALVQRAKDERWVLPRGKLKRDENPAAGARREVVEETGHRVKVREFLGAITYRARGRPKVVQFWHMQAAARPSRDVMKDIVAVEWLPLAAAVRRLSYPLEKLFLHHVGRALKRRRRKPGRHKSAGKTARKTARKPVKSRKLRRRARKKTAARPMRKKRRLARSRHPARTAQPGIFRRMFGRG